MCSRCLKMRCVLTGAALLYRTVFFFLICADVWMFTDVSAYRPLDFFWCSGVTECPTEDETVISSRHDNGAPVVTGTEEEYEGEEERGGVRVRWGDGGCKVCWRNQ